MTVFDRLIRVGEGRLLRTAKQLTERAGAFEPALAVLTDEQLRAKTAQFRDQLSAGAGLDGLLPEAFAVVREAAKRTLGMRPYDVQLVGGAALHFGQIAEMKTGEGKTLVAALPAYLNALTGAGVHVVTVNDYLARRDASTIGMIHRFLGLTVGILSPEMTTSDRRKAYAADITYGTNSQFGFDYLRDNLTRDLSQIVQRGHAFAIVDEVDSILIDEARTPLIISAESGAAEDVYVRFADLARQMVTGIHYELDEKMNAVGLLEPGMELAEATLGIDNLYADEHSHHIVHVLNAVKAKALFIRDKDYVLVDDRVTIVDENTGRLMPARRFDGGMHQALEAKEGVGIRAETHVLASVTLQNFFRLYTRLSGMTGTASTEAAEFWQVYKLGVTVVPTHRPVQRVDRPDLVFRNSRGKFNSVVADIIDRHAAGQPILVGTSNVDKSEYLSRLLTRAGVPHEVLNAKQHEREAGIVASAGRAGRVTIATNMAGRGTDIMLGGDAPHLADEQLLTEGISVTGTPDEYAAAYPEALAAAKLVVAAEREIVLAAGGLYVLGTERNDSRRIDDQLRGRSGRQGDPGMTRFYLALDDDMMRVFKGNAIERILAILDVPEEVPIESANIAKSIRGAQAEAEGQNYEQRKSVLKFDDVLNRQRLVIYKERQDLLVADSDTLEKLWLRFAEEAVRTRVELFAPADADEAWRVGELLASFTEIYPVALTSAEILESHPVLTKELLVAEILSDLRLAVDARLDGMEDRVRSNYIRISVITSLDAQWRGHLYELEYLREGIHLRAYAQKDPALEYEREAHRYFSEMITMILQDSLKALFSMDLNAFLVDQLLLKAFLTKEAAKTASPA